MIEVKRFCLLIFLIFSIISTAICCDCIMTPLENHIEEVQFLLRVKAVQILDTKEEREEYSFPNYSIEKDIGYRAKLEVVKNLKGNLNRGDLIDISTTFSNCELKYKIGEEYILFLRQENNDFFLETCSYSEKLTNNRKSKIFYRKILRKLKNRN